MASGSRGDIRSDFSYRPGSRGDIRLFLVAFANVGFTPLTDLGSESYQGRQGGLYSGGASVRPTAHDDTGLALARSIQLVGAAPQTNALADQVRAVTLASWDAHLKNDCRSLACLNSDELPRASNHAVQLTRKPHNLSETTSL